MGEYKESGIKWIGKIPQNWEIKRIKHIYNLQTGFTPDTSNIEYYDDENGFTWVSIADMNKKYISTSKTKISKLYVKEKHPQKVKKGSLLYSFKLSVGKMAFNEVDLYTNEAIASFINNEKVCLDYLYYAGYLIEYNSNINIYGAKILNQNLINNAVIVNPPYNEQRKIAEFLNKKILKIENILENLNKQIDILNNYKKSKITEVVKNGLKRNVEKKDSGIDWIGKIPNNWKISKINYIAKINGRIGFKGYSQEDLVDEGEGAYTIGGEHITNNIIDLTNPKFISWKKYFESPEIMVKKGDIIIAQRGTLGKVAIVEKEIGKATINPSLAILNNLKIYGKYLYYFLLSDVNQTEIILDNTTTAIPMISQRQISRFNVIIPSDKEQVEISNYLDKECEKIHSFIEIKKQQIIQLENYKESLIYEYVTGKKRVKGE